MNKQVLYVQKIGDRGCEWIGSDHSRMNRVRLLRRQVSGQWPAWAEYTSIIAVALAIVLGN